MTVRISVALATYNGERFIAEQIQSILRQTVPVAQIVIADDGSTDRTLEIARVELAEFSGDVTVLEPVGHPLGVTRNFERALHACDGELIALADQDDVWHDNKLATLTEALGDGLLVFSDAELVDSNGKPFDPAARLFDGLGLTSWERDTLERNHAWEVLLRRNVVTGATVLLRRELLSLAGAFPSAWVHDEWLAVVAAAHGAVRFCEEPTIDYRQHDSNQIGMRRKLTWAARFRRLRAPRAARNARLLERATALSDRAREWPAPAPEDAIEKHAHELIRSHLPGSRFARIRPVLAERRTGRYERFGLGMQDVVRDMVQPAR